MGILESAYFLNIVKVCLCNFSFLKLELPIRNKLGVVSILEGAQRLFEVGV